MNITKEKYREKDRGNNADPVMVIMKDSRLQSDISLLVL